MTYKTYISLKPYERALYNAYRLKFCRMNNSDAIKIFKLTYGTGWQKKVSQSWNWCSSCKLTEITKVGAEYFKYKENHPDADDVAVDNVAVDDTNTDDTDTDDTGETLDNILKQL